MIFKTIIFIIVGFVTVVIAIPMILSAVGINILPGAGGLAQGSELLFRSEDGGEYWKPAVFVRGRRDPAPSYIYDIAAHPTATTTLFAATRSAGLWKSEDAGATWRQVQDSSGALDPRSDIYRVVISRSRPDVMYLAVYQAGRGKVLRSTDGGASFHQIYFVGQQRHAVFDVFTPPNAPDTVMVATGEGRLLVSHDGGRYWRFSKVISDSLARLVMHPWYSNEGYLLTDKGQVYRTYDSGESWSDLGILGRTLRRTSSRVVEHPYNRLSFTTLRPGTSRQTLRNALVPDPHHGGVLYRTNNGSILTSVNGGSAWQPLSTFIEGLGVPVGGIAVHPREPDTLVVTAGQAVYTSHDRGITWSITSLSSRVPLREVYIHPEVPAILFIATGT